MDSNEECDENLQEKKSIAKTDFNIPIKKQKKNRTTFEIERESNENENYVMELSLNGIVGFFVLFLSGFRW